MADSQLTRRSYKGNANPNWQGGKVEKTCLRCKSKFRVRHGYRTARFCTLDCFNLWQKETSPRAGIPKKAQIEMECLWCGKHFFVQPSWASRKKCCGTRCHRKWRSSKFSKGGNPNWRGGTSKLPYPFMWNEIKKKVMSRDGMICQNPLCWGKCSIMNVHHIDYDKNNCDMLNLIVLCASCNGRANFNRPWWESYYKTIIVPWIS